MSGYGFTVGSSGNDDEDRGVGFQPAVQNRVHNPTHEILRVSSQTVTHDAIIARHAALQFAPAIYFQDGPQTIADYPAGTAAGSPTYTYVYASYIDEPVMRGGSGGLRYYHRNQQYSITAVSDGGGSVVERYAYSAYGKVTIADASGSVISDSAIANRYTYTGREWDAGLSLYHYRARMYDAVGGRFVGRDPIGYVDSHALYMLGNNNTTSGTDPTGLKFKWNVFHAACALVATCWESRRQIFNENGYQELNSQQWKCMRKLKGIVGGGYMTGRCFSNDLFIGNKLTVEANTPCHPMCQAKWTFIKPEYATCAGCENAIASILTLLHECVHRNHQACPLDGDSTCQEPEAYGKSQRQVMADRPRLCQRLVAEGMCSDIDECQATITKAIEDDQLNLAEYVAACKRKQLSNAR